MNIVILYEHIVRELDAVNSLRAALEKRGHHCEVFSGDFEVTNAYAYARKNRVDVILMPWFVDDEHFDLIYPVLRSNPDIKVVNLHHEQISSRVYERLLLPHNPLTEKNSYHFAWGTYFAGKLLEHGVPRERIYITGNIRNDKVFRIEKSKARLAEQFRLDAGKKWILYAENRGFASQRMNRSLKDALRNRGLSEEALEESARNSAEGLADFYEILKKLPESFLRQYEFIYRPHPGTRISESFPEGIHVIAELPIYEWIANSDLFLTCESTSIFEAEACGVPCATFNNMPSGELFRMAGLDRYPSLRSLSEITDRLITETARRQKRSPIYTDYLGPVDGHAIERTAAAIEAVGKEQSSIDFLGHRQSGKALVRRYLYEAATRISVKTGLLETIKFPRSSYWSSRDIPYTEYNRETYFQVAK